MKHEICMPHELTMQFVIKRRNEGDEKNAYNLDCDYKESALGLGKESETIHYEIRPYIFI